MTTARAKMRVIRSFLFFSIFQNSIPSITMIHFWIHWWDWGWDAWVYGGSPFSVASVDRRGESWNLKPWFVEHCWAWPSCLISTWNCWIRSFFHTVSDIPKYPALHLAPVYQVMLSTSCSSVWTILQFRWWIGWNSVWQDGMVVFTVLLMLSFSLL